MSKFNKIALLLVATATFAVNAMEKKATSLVSLTHEDRVSRITPQTIIGMLAPLSSEQDRIVRSWTHENAWILAQLVEISSFNDFPAIYKANTEQLEAIGVKNLGTSNYDFQIPGSAVIAKVSGMATRRQNIIAGQDQMTESNNLINAYSTSLEGAAREAAFENIKRFRTQRFAEYQRNPVKTYQGISRAAYYILLKETQEQENLNDIYVPQTNIVAFTGKEDESHVSDESHFVVEEYLEDLQKMTPEVLRDLSPKTIVQILKAINGASLWSIGGNLGVRADEKTVVLHDLEQPDCMSPQNFVLKNKERAQIDAAIGIREVLDLIHNNENQLDAAREFITNDEEIILYSWYENHILPGLKLQ